MNEEKNRLQEEEKEQKFWKKWGPYLSERQWGTVREDYSHDGKAWEYFPHDHARSRAYRWGEDGIGGISDDQQFLCFAVALWNGHDPILKERLFGLTGKEGNHGEDVKECYYYLDNTPTHSYMKMLYKYPQSEYPYHWLVEENHRRGKHDPEFELLDTGIFDKDCYFDVFIEYAKASPDDILIQITAHNRGEAEAPLHLLPQCWFRNTWSWYKDAVRPHLHATNDTTVAITHPQLGEMWLFCEGQPTLLFCDNETNVRRLYHNDRVVGYFKDAVHEYVVRGNHSAVHPNRMGTKVAAQYIFSVPAKDSVSVRLRLRSRTLKYPFRDFSSIWNKRVSEANAFYEELQASLMDEDRKNIQRQALAGMLWTKQFYYFDVAQWLQGDEEQPPPSQHRHWGRNHQWTHLHNADVISMPDTWEYPWYAVWDLAFHCIPLAMIDPAFAKRQLMQLTKEWYMHPNGQLPAYEWAFEDVNPPVHAWAAWQVYQIDQQNREDRGDILFLRRIFHKLLLNFTWWVNRKDRRGRNLFQGGFLGLDNIGLFDRSASLPTGGYIEQADGTSWMAMYSLNLLRIALELAQDDSSYEDLASKFFEHFLHIAGAMVNISGEGIGLWHEEDKFFYDVLHLSGENLRADQVVPMKIRSMVGLIPLFAVEILEPEQMDRLPNFKRRMEWFLQHRPDLAQLISRWNEPGLGDRRLLSLLRGHRMKCILKRMLDETEFFSPYGIRALSRYHKEHPYTLDLGGQSYTVSYQPGESDSYLFGGNSNWRGPIWFPVNFLIMESLHKFHHYYGEDFKIECPTGSGNFITIQQAAHRISERLQSIFLRDEQGKRPVFGDVDKLQFDPYFRDHLLFYEYFHGDNGRGIGASHQTGWTGLIAALLSPRVV